MAVTSFQNLPLADRTWDGAAAEKRVRRWAGAEDEPNQRYRDAHVWYDAGKKQNFTAYQLLIADVAGGELTAVPRGVGAAQPTVCASRATASATRGPNMTGSLWSAPVSTTRSVNEGAWSATRALSSEGTTESRSP